MDSATPVIAHNDTIYEVITEDTDQALVYMPGGYEFGYGLIFYVGTFLPPSVYPYIAEYIASRGYVVVIPKVKYNAAYINYQEIEAAFAAYPQVRFFTGGHSQGGGAALRRAYEERERVLGAVLYSPLCYGSDTLKYTAMPVLLVEAENDRVLTETMKADARSRLPEGYSHLLVEGGNHMGYCVSGFPFDGEQVIAKAEMQSIVAESTVAFMKNIIDSLTEAEE